MEDQSLGSEEDGLTEAARVRMSEEVKVRKPPLAGVEMYLEDIQAIGPFDQLHRGGIAWINLKWIDGLTLQDEIDSIDAHKMKLSGNGSNDLAYATHEIAPFGLPRPHGPEDAPAVTKTVRPELCPANKLLGDTQQTRIPTIRSEHCATWQAVQVLLKKIISLKAISRQVNGDPMATPASQRFA